MRYVSSIPPVTPSPITREVSALSAVHAVKAVYAPERAVTYVQLHDAQSSVSGVEQQYQKQQSPLHDQNPHPELPVAPAPVIPSTDRRKYCRRVSHQPVLEELRSGIDRRHHSLLEGGVVEHIDEVA